jgi:uncharacterized Fe-S center protein
MSSKPSAVYYGSIQHGNPGRFASFSQKVDAVVKKLDFSTIEKKDKVAVKMHLGFNDGYQTIPVFFVRRIVKAVKKAGGYPYVTDNPTAVYNAVNRGYTSETCGCPILPTAGVKDGYTYKTKIEYKNVDSLELVGSLHDADVLIENTLRNWSSPVPRSASIMMRRNTSSHLLLTCATSVWNVLRRTRT